MDSITKAGVVLTVLIDLMAALFLYVGLIDADIWMKVTLSTFVILMGGSTAVSAALAWLTQAKEKEKNNA